MFRLMLSFAHIVHGELPRRGFLFGGNFDVKKALFFFFFPSQNQDSVF